jgi:hypothetical protein
VVFGQAGCLKTWRFSVFWVGSSYYCQCVCLYVVDVLNTCGSFSFLWQPPLRLLWVKFSILAFILSSLFRGVGEVWLSFLYEE